MSTKTTQAPPTPAWKSLADLQKLSLPDQRTLSDGYPEGDSKRLYKAILEQKRKDNDDPDPYLFEVVDGQQRIRTMLEFMGVKPPNAHCYRGAWLEPFNSQQDSPIAKGKRYDQLNVDQKIRFDEKPLTIMILENANIQEVRDMFLRLQNGTPLNAQQKRDATGSQIGRAARLIADLPFFKISAGFDDAGSAHHSVASQMLHLEIKERIVSCTSRQLDKLYDHYKSTPVDPPVIARTKKVVEILGRVFPGQNPHLNQNYALSLYWLISRILLTYTIPETEYSKIRDNFERMDVARIESRNAGYPGPDGEMFEDLSLAMSRGNTGIDGISTRHDIVGRYLFQGIGLVPRPELDPTRDFTHEEKLVLYYRARGCCQLEHGQSVCGRPIEFDDAVVDHIIPHSKQGRTELANGRIAFKLCNIARGNRDDFDPKAQCHLSTASVAKAE